LRYGGERLRAAEAKLGATSFARSPRSPSSSGILPPCADVPTSIRSWSLAIWRIGAPLGCATAPPRAGAGWVSIPRRSLLYGW